MTEVFLTGAQWAVVEECVRRCEGLLGGLTVIGGAIVFLLAALFFKGRGVGTGG